MVDLLSLKKTWQSLAEPSEIYFQVALEQQYNLLKPQKSLGDLEQIAIRLASLQATDTPEINPVYIDLFAADHGVAKHPVSAYPQEVTQQMILSFLAGHAAISVLSQQIHACLKVHSLGLINRLEQASNSAFANHHIGFGTQDFTMQAAMTETQLIQALTYGKQAVIDAHQSGCRLWIGAEMGIGNTTVSTALIVALYDVDINLLTGLGTGITEQNRQLKIALIENALKQHAQAINSPWDALQLLGGFEIVALVAGYLECARLGIPALVDGWIASTAAAYAHAINPNVLAWLFFAHRSAEQGHQWLLERLKVKPILDLNLRLGEGSGAALAVPVLNLSCQLHNQMGSFKSAGVARAG